VVALARGGEETSREEKGMEGTRERRRGTKQQGIGNQ